MCAATTGPRATRTPARARRCPWVTPAPLPARAGRCVHHVPQHRCQHAHLQQWQHSCSGLRTVVCAASSSSGNGSAAAAGGDAAGSSSSSSSSRSHQSGLPGLLQKWRRDTQQMQQELQALGAAGVIAYGGPVRVRARKRPRLSQAPEELLPYDHTTLTLPPLAAVVPHAPAAARPVQHALLHSGLPAGVVPVF
jgi:hypothetical protein